MPAAYPIHQLENDVKRHNLQNSGDMYTDIFGNVFSMMEDKLPEGDSDYVYRPGKHDRLRAIQGSDTRHHKEEVLADEPHEKDIMDDNLSMMFTSVRTKTNEIVLRQTSNSKRGQSIEDTNLDDRRKNPALVRNLQKFQRELHKPTKQELPANNRTTPATSALQDDQASTKRFAHYKIKNSDTTRNTRHNFRENNRLESMQLPSSEAGKLQVPRSSRVYNEIVIPMALAMQSSMLEKAVAFSPGQYNLRLYKQKALELLRSSIDPRLHAIQEDHNSLGQIQEVGPSMEEEFGLSTTTPFIRSSVHSSKGTSITNPGKMSLMSEEKSVTFRDSLELQGGIQDMENMVKSYMRARKSTIEEMTPIKNVEAPKITTLSHEDQFKQSVKQVFKNNKVSMFDMKLNEINAHTQQSDMMPESASSMSQETVRGGKDESTKTKIQAPMTIQNKDGQITRMNPVQGKDQSLEVGRDRQINRELFNELKEPEINVREIKKQDGEMTRMNGGNEIIDTQRVLEVKNTKEENNKFRQKLNESMLRHNKVSPMIERPQLLSNKKRKEKAMHIDMLRYSQENRVSKNKMIPEIENNKTKFIVA